MTINGFPYKVLWLLLPELYKMINANTNANPRGRSTEAAIVILVVLYKIDLLQISQLHRSA